jgi:hypothetical protein
MAGPGPRIPTWDEAMQQAAVWLAKAEKDSAKKLGDPIGAASADVRWRRRGLRSPRN